MTLRKTLSIILILIGFLIAIWGQFTLLAGIPFFIIGVIINFTTNRPLWVKLAWTILPIALWLPSMLGFWHLKNKAASQGDTYIFPKGFHGQAIIAFGVTNGDSIMLKNGRRTFSFDTSGILVTQAEPPSGIVDQQFYFQDKNGQLTRLARYGYQINTKDNNDSAAIKVFGWNEKGSTAANKCEYQFFNFKICSLAELDTIDNGFKSWKLHDKIKKIACGQ